MDHFKDKRARLLARGVLINEDDILLLKNTNILDNTYFILPGRHIEFGS